VKSLYKFAKLIRYHSMECIASCGSGHVGGVLSIADLLAVLYGKIMNIDSSNPLWEERDRLVMSKGHCGPALYAALALKGFFPIEELRTLNQNGTRLPSHCNTLTPGVDFSTGSLGQGASLAVGVALALKKKNNPARTFLILGDGECNEGQIWESAMFAAHYGLDNIIAFVDQNKQQLDGDTRDVMSMENLEESFLSFGWFVKKVAGHNLEKIEEAILNAIENKGKPSLIVLDTIKGKGWTGAEGKPKVHHLPFTEKDLEILKNEIGLLGD